MLRKLRYILQGWKNYVWENKEMEAAAKKKADECAKCKNAVMSVWDDVLPDASLVEVKGMKCALCDCPHSTLLRSDKPCPIGKF